MDAENRKIVRVSLAVTALIAVYLLNRAFVFTANTAGWANQRIFDVVPLSMVLAATLGGALYAWLTLREQVSHFLNEVVNEVRKVTWPTRKETGMSTVVVVVLVFITAVILWAYDWLWSTILGLIL